LFWLVGAINSLNLLDGIDGLATTIGIILCAAITVMAVWFAQPAVAIVAAVFAGALVGFLRFNFPPASIYLGDAGSMLIGLVVGSLAIGASLKGPATVAMATTA
jgi:UDP-GlcNAc:undecaprenyl-phosphate GlcNAc-1-phosphate transferase